MISKFTASGMISLLTVLFLPLLFSSPQMKISDVASHGEAIITVEKIKLDVQYQRLLNIVKDSIESK